MKTHKKNAKIGETQSIAQSNPVQGYVGDPQIFLSRDGESMIHRLPGNMRFELHVNLYKKIFGAEFTPKERRDPADPMASRPRTYGFIAQPEVFLTRDGQYLVHRAPGVRISKHVNFYKKILGIPFTAKSETGITAQGSQVA